MKSVGIGVLRWLCGILFGVVAAGVVFLLGTLIAGPAGGPFGLVLLGFGLAFFPAVFAAGARSPRSVIRRAAVTFALIGVAAAGMEGYQLFTGQTVIAPETFAVFRQIEAFGTPVAGQVQPLYGLVFGAFLVLLSIILFLLLRPAARGAAPVTRATAVTPPTRANAAAPAATPPSSAARPAAAPAPAPKQVPPPAAKPGLDDEDAQLMADLENLRKKLPKMGSDQ